jgi:cell wall-active antibiotic response 4TMS protein YvqF
MKSSSIFWSIFLICVGIIFLLKEFNIFPYDLDFVFNLWPIVFILWGLALFKIPSIIKKSMVGLSGLVAAMFVMAVVTHDYNPGCSDNIHFSIDHPNDFDEEDYYDDLDSNEYSEDYTKFVSDYDHQIISAKLKLEAGAGKFVISDSSEHLIEGNSQRIAADMSTFLDEDDSTRAIVKLDMAFVNMKKKNRKSGYIKLSPDPVWDLEIAMGAGKFIGDFRDIKVKNIDVEAGAANVELILGMNEKDVDIEVGAGMAKILIRVPKEAGCRILDGDDFFVSKNLHGFVTRGKEQFSPNYDSTDTKITIRMEGGMAKFEVIRY